MDQEMDIVICMLGQLSIINVMNLKADLNGVLLFLFFSGFWEGSGKKAGRELNEPTQRKQNHRKVLISVTFGADC